jgi:hypothetical protein
MDAENEDGGGNGVSTGDRLGTQHGKRVSIKHYLWLGVPVHCFLLAADVDR